MQTDARAKPTLRVLGSREAQYIPFAHDGVAESTPTQTAATALRALGSREARPRPVRELRPGGRRRERRLRGVSEAIWTKRAQAYRESETHRERPDLDLLVEWAAGAENALDVATGGGHVARRLREAGVNVVTVDPAPGMQPDVIARAEDLPFADRTFDVVVTRIAPHHFADVRGAVKEMARLSRDLVLIEDSLFSSERHEEAERLRDPSHVRNYTEREWRSFLGDAGLEIESIFFLEKRHPLEDWLARTGCEGAEAARVRELLADRMTPDGQAWTDTKILIRARKADA